MTATHREIESKFDVAEDLELSGLAGVARVSTLDGPIEQRLDAEYYDTADHRLAAAGIGLRRRTGGDDAGWHLKITESLGERIEVHRPLGRSNRVPKALRDLVTVHVRDAELDPVARLHTQRRLHQLMDDSGAVIAEVADDEVRADNADGDQKCWREVEVELVDNDDSDLLEALGCILIDAGASPSTHRSKLERAIGDTDQRAAVGSDPDLASGAAGRVVAAYLNGQVAALVDVDPAVRVDLEDAVHKMRVAIRRLRSALATYRRLLHRDVTDPLRDELKWLGGVLGPARDAEVIRDHLDAVVQAEPASLIAGPVRRRIDTTLNRDHRRARQQALTAMTSARYLALIDKLTQVGQSVVDSKRARRAAPKELRKHVGRTHRRMRRALDEALSGDDGPNDEQLHEVRKAAKRVRYAAESVTDVYGSKASKLATRMEGAQDTLGDHQDTVVIRGVLRRLEADATAAGESTFTYGRLHALEQVRGDAARDAYLAAAKDRWANPPGWLR
jgi:CHAD domain-containing protein